VAVDEPVPIATVEADAADGSAAGKIEDHASQRGQRKPRDDPPVTAPARRRHLQLGS
jgi:hypothetical protein